MKKAQILSAIALAFALGIVAPVASTVSALTLEKENDYGVVVTAGKASYDEAQNAIAYAENTDADYKRLANFYNVALAAYKTDVGPITIAAGLGTTINKATVVWVNHTAVETVSNSAYEAVQAIDTALGAGTRNIDNIVSHLDADGRAAFTGTISNATKVTPATATKVLRAIAGAVEDYNLYHALYAAETYDEYKVAAEAFNDNLPAGATALNTTRAGYLTYTTQNQYAKYADLFNIVDPALEAFSVYNTQLAKVEAAYKVLENNGQIKPAGKTAYANVTPADDWHTIGDIITVVMKTGVNDLANEDMKFNTTNVDGAAEWNALSAAIKTLSQDTKKTGEGAIYNHIKAVAEAYKEATGDKTELNDLIVKMTGYKAPAGDTDTDKPGDDQNADADAPNTGALLSSDKGATTVSIVAGLATALTALGAGVVAYRNARRSSK